MSYDITIKQQHKGIPEGTKGEKVEGKSQSMYRFKADGSKFDYATFSWNYIQNHKQYFNVNKQGE